MQLRAAQTSSADTPAHRTCRDGFFFVVNVSTLLAFGFYIQEKYLHVSVMSGGVVVKGRPLPPWG